MVRVARLAAVPFVLLSALLLPQVAGQAPPTLSRTIAPTSRIASSAAPAGNGRLSSTVTGMSSLASGQQLSASTAATAISSVASLLPSASPSSIPAAVDNAGPVPTAPTLDTKLDAAFGLLGAILILTGLVMALAGSAYRRLAVFITLLYAFAIITLVLILHFGVEQQVSQPSQGIRCAFLVACLAAGVITGICGVIFHRGAKMVIPPVAGFLLGLTIQCLKNDGLIHQLGLRYLLYLGLTGAAFLMACIPRFFDATLLASVAFLGSLAFALGVDCFSTENLKEFYIYNLGFSALFPKMAGRFDLTSAMQIELGIVALVFVIGLAVQIRFFNIFETRIQALLKRRSNRERVENEEEKASHRLSSAVGQDMEKFEHRYSRGFPFVVPELSSQMSSPAIPHSVLSTPKSESAPLLPELQYVSNAFRKHSTRNTRDLSIHTGSNDSQHNAMEAQELLVRPQAINASSTPKDSLDLVDEIRVKEQELQEIARLRQGIGQIRSSLRPPSADGSDETAHTALTSPRSPPPPSPPPNMPLPPPPAVSAKPVAQRHSVSFSGISETRPRSEVASFVAPRPISQHSVLVIPSRSSVQPPRPPGPQHAQSASILPGHTRNLSSNSIQLVQDDTDGSKHRRRSSSTAFLGPSQNAQRIQAAVVMNRPVSGVISNEPQRIVTGMLPRSNSQTTVPTSASLPRTQTMDIRDLEARHRRRLSEMQGTSSRCDSTSSEKIGMAKSPSQTLSALPQSSPARKRSSTIEGLSSYANHQPLASRRDSSMSGGMGTGGRRHSRLDEFGKYVAAHAPVAGAQNTAPAGYPSQPKRRGSGSQQTGQTFSPSAVAASSAPAPPLKKSASDWLSY